MRIAALLELPDGFQIVAAGALRGFGDTCTLMLAHLVGYRALGLPVIYVLCYPLHWGVSGIWVGLTAALILIGTSPIVAWKRMAAPEFDGFQIVDTAPSAASEIHALPCWPTW